MARSNESKFQGINNISPTRRTRRAQTEEDAEIMKAENANAERTENMENAHNTSGYGHLWPLGRKFLMNSGQQITEAS